MTVSPVAARVSTVAMLRAAGRISPRAAVNSARPIRRTTAAETSFTHDSCGLSCSRDLMVLRTSEAAKATVSRLCTIRQAHVHRSGSPLLRGSRRGVAGRGAIRVRRGTPCRCGVSRGEALGIELKTSSASSRLVVCSSQYIGEICSGRAASTPGRTETPIDESMPTWAAWMPVPDEFLVQVHRPVAQRRRGGVDVGDPRVRPDRAGPGGVEQGARAGLAHHRQHRLGGSDGPVQLEVHLELHMGRFGSGRSSQRGDAERAHWGIFQDVDPTELCCGVLERRARASRSSTSAGNAAAVMPSAVRVPTRSSSLVRWRKSGRCRSPGNRRYGRWPYRTGWLRQWRCWSQRSFRRTPSRRHERR